MGGERAWKGLHSLARPGSRSVPTEIGTKNKLKFLTEASRLQEKRIEAEKNPRAEQICLSVEVQAGCRSLALNI